MKEEEYKTDDIIDTIEWLPVYYFVVLKRSKLEDKLPEIRHIGPIPELAYALLEEEMIKDVGSVHENSYEYYLQDSFQRDALAFCRKKADEYIQSTELTLMDEVVELLADDKKDFKS